jgi:hypothetical protein
MERLTTFGKYSAEIGTYIYRLIDPRSGHTFYVGKGRGDRVFAHANNQAKELEEPKDDIEDEEYLLEKNKCISEIIRAHLDVLYVIHRHSIETVAKEIIEEVRRGGRDEKSLLTSVSDKIAYEVEAALIDAYAYESLSNRVKGHGNSERGCQHAVQLKSKYQKDPLVAEEQLIALSVGNSYKNNDLDKAVRLAWRANLEKAKQQDYVLAHDAGMVIGVYKVEPKDWLEATPANFPGEIEIVDYETNERALKARIGIRAGGLKEAPAAIVTKYKDHVLPPSRTTNPVRYFSPEEPVLLNNFE